MNTDITILFNFLKETISYRLNVAGEIAGFESLAVPVLDTNSLNQDKELSKFIIREQLSVNEIITLLLALIPNLQPNFIGDIVSEVYPSGGEFSEFGGIKGKNHRGILPNGETVLFVLHGNDLELRKQAIELFFKDSMLFKNNILFIENITNEEPQMSGRLGVDPEYLSLFIKEQQEKPTLSKDFPASLITTNLDWEDLVLNSKTTAELKEIETWIKYNNTLVEDWSMGSKIKPGYRVLLFGPPGTGKTLTASLLGKITDPNRDVYRVDLSMVVSKYIGETEKNLSNLFNKAINKDWILFFDEADAIFGKRTSVRDAHDKYANQEVSYLLQRIESHPGLVILASNFKNNIDVAFTRRFQSIIEFETPAYQERLRLWTANLTLPLDTDVSLENLSQKYALTGANIVNVVQYASLKAIAFAADNGLGSPAIQKQFIIDGIRKEYIKEGKTVAVG